MKTTQWLRRATRWATSLTIGLAAAGFGAAAIAQEAWKIGTVVAPPWRTWSSPVCAIRCSASRTAGRETPSTSASRRSLGRLSPAGISPSTTSASTWSKTSSGTDRRTTGCNGMEATVARLLV